MPASVLEYRNFSISRFFLFLRALSSRIGSNALALRSSSLPRRERVRGLRHKRDVGTILGFGGHARAFFRMLTGGVVVREHKGITFQHYTCGGRNYILSAVCIAAPKSSCPCCFAAHPRVSITGRCTPHFFTVLLWRGDRLERPPPCVLR